MSDPTEEFLAHFGVKGMHWGKHKSSGSSGSSSSSGGQKSRSELRSLNKAAKAEQHTQRKADFQKEADKHDREVMTARKNVDKHAADYSAAKKQYKVDKKVVGRVAAKQVLKQHEEKFLSTFNKATLNTTKEQHAQQMQELGAQLATAAFAVGASAYGSRR